jgi:hypothetical protein
MRPIGLEDILGRERYAQGRDGIRRRLVRYKHARRLAVGDEVSLVFEDRATVWYQTQEMLWVEHIVDLDAIRAEIDVYNALLPEAGSLSATLLIELRDQRRMREDFRRFLGLDRHVHLEIGDARVPARFEAGRQDEDRISAVQYLRFPVEPAAREMLERGATVAVAIDHPNYRARAVLDPATRASVIGGLLDDAVADAGLRFVRDGMEPE